MDLEPTFALITVSAVGGIVGGVAGAYVHPLFVPVGIIAGVMGGPAIALTAFGMYCSAVEGIDKLKEKL